MARVPVPAPVPHAHTHPDTSRAMAHGAVCGLAGMTKTLHLYEAHFVALVEEVLASPQRLMATAVLEPYMGTPRPASQPTQPQQGEGVGAPGSDAGGTMSLAIQWMTSQASQGVGGQGVALDGFLGVLGDELGGASSSGRGRGSADDASWLPLGAYVGGSNYLLSCGCLVKVRCTTLQHDLTGPRQAACARTQAASCTRAAAERHGTARHGMAR